MKPLPPHGDNVLASQGLPENRGSTEERKEILSPSSIQNVSGQETRKPRRLILREEWVDLTRSLLAAALLEQLTHLCQKTADFDLYQEEEKSHSSKDHPSLQYGWFYKPHHELMEETMLCVTLGTFRRYMSFLIHKGWIQTRTNPENKLDRRTQYRVNLKKLYADLHKKGHVFPDFETYRIFSPSNTIHDFQGGLYGN